MMKNEPEKVGRETQISSAMAKLHGNIEHAEKTIHALRDRLDAALMPQPAVCKPTEKGVPPGPSVPLACSIDSVANHVFDLTALLEDTLNRVEL